MQGRQARMLRKTMQTAPKSLVSGLKERRCDVEGCARVQRLRRCERTDYVAATFRSAPLMAESHGDDGKNVHCNGERKPRPLQGRRDNFGICCYVRPSREPAIGKALGQGSAIDKAIPRPA